MPELPKTYAHGGAEERFVASLVKVGDGHAAGINKLESFSWFGHKGNYGKYAMNFDRRVEDAYPRP
jgi:hypothetical protein